ncbi:hypothetical protein [Amnibacterium sp.]|uniref:hypothetical protein n=1 Tax=Amnibacterium sp. TaxID=1872496 RepID=UPI003F7C64C0
MSDADDLIAWERMRLEAELSGPLGGVRSASRRADADRERAVRLAADNLLDKALRRVVAGDDGAARRLVDRALRLTVDELEPAVDAALAVHLFVWDALRAAALEGGHESWLDRAEAVALGGVAEREWRSALRSLAAEGDLPQPDLRRLRALVGATGEQMVLATVEHDDRVDATVQLLHAIRDVTA